MTKPRGLAARWKQLLKRLDADVKKNLVDPVIAALAIWSPEPSSVPLSPILEEALRRNHLSPLIVPATHMEEVTQVAGGIAQVGTQVVLTPEVAALTE
jgi:hypothetical protein